MRLISPLAGVAAVQVSVDDVLPRRNILQRELVNFVGNLYKFTAKPVVPPALPAGINPVLMFQSGQFERGEDRIPIIQLMIFSDGDAVTASDTDLADVVLDDFLNQLDAGLGYRFGESRRPNRLYSSSVVVEFDERFVEGAGTINTIQGILNEVLHPQTSYGLRRLAFSPEDPPTNLPTLVFNSVREAVPTEFAIEPRAGEPRARGRYFCGAPLRTSDNVRLLERIERAVIEQT